MLEESREAGILMLTELEGAVLGIVARKPPLTAYAIRKEFENAVTQSWSASAGAIYPLVRRLVDDGLLKETSKPNDGRGTILLRLSPAGRASLIDWLKAGDPKALGPAADPMRTRGFAFSELPSQDRIPVLHDWRALTKRSIELIREQIERFEQEQDRTAAIATRGTQLQLEARLQWIDEMIEQAELH